LTRIGSVADLWILIATVMFAGIGINHVASREADSTRVFLVAIVLAAFLGSLGLVASRPGSRGALAVNVAAIVALLGAATAAWLLPGLMSVRWSSADRMRNSVLFFGRVWTGILWLTILGAAAAAEVHHVVRAPGGLGAE
jgi:hypothetical protein